MAFETEDIKTISFPLDMKKDWKEYIEREIKSINASNIKINCRKWILNYKQLTYVERLLKKYQVKLSGIKSYIPKTIVSAISVGLDAELVIQKESKDTPKTIGQKKIKDSLAFHQGTLRSGESIFADGDILFVGDINPGAHISAEGNVLIWGRLRGIAHAGKSGNKKSKIIALELRPLQLRIADKVARGPSEQPEQGLAEQAQLENDQIVIKPASSKI
tara:strand:- start:1481 stop:2134 length:654 start_codon:yes stop_codon:yes gene_type:complete